MKSEGEEVDNIKWDSMHKTPNGCHTITLDDICNLL